MPDAPYERQFFICTFGPWCRLEGSDLIRAKMKDAVKDADLTDRIRITKCGCLGQCGNGPMAVVWPENVWYAGLTQEDIPALLEHVTGKGPALEAKRYRPGKRGTNKTAEVQAKEAEKGKVTE